MSADETLSLIRARCPEISASELALIEAALSGETLPMSALADVVTVLDGLGERMDAFAEALAA